MQSNMKSKLIMVIVMSIWNSHRYWGIEYFNEKLPWYHRNKALKKIVLKSLGHLLVCINFFIVKTIVKLVYNIVNLSLLNIWSNYGYSRKQLISTMRGPLMQSIYFTIILQKLQICNGNLMMQWEPILKWQKNTWWSHVGFHPSRIRFFNKNTLITKVKKNKESVLLSWYYRSVKTLLSLYDSNVHKDHAKQGEKEQIEWTVCKLANKNNLCRNQHQCMCREIFQNT